MSDEPIAKQTILAVFSSSEDRRLLDNLLGRANRQLLFTASLAETQRALRSGPIALILSDRRLLDGHDWKDILQELQGMPNAPPLIVADRLPNGALWAELLNLGGFDLLRKPFDLSEVLHAGTNACHFAADQRNRAVPSKA